MQLLESKSLLLVLALLACITSCTAQQKIIYTHIGISDKPICTIEILLSEQKDTSNFCRKIFLVDKGTFRLLKSYVKKSDNHISTVETMEYPYGTFKVLLLEKSKKYEIIISKEESIAFFGNQLPLLSSNIKLYNEIEVLLNRLK
jgi:hypothetical protein